MADLITSASVQASKANAIDALNATKASATAASTSDETEDRFLKLLIAQMNNQDPLNPLDNSQVTSQLAQINTVRGIEQMNSTLSKFVSAQNGTKALDAAGLIGRSALVDGSSATVVTGQPTNMRVGAALASDAASMKIELVDASGAVARTFDLGKQSAGVVSAAWDGTRTGGSAAAAGRYTVRVTALDGNGKAVDATPLVTAQVVGATQAGDVTRISLANGASVAPGDLRGIFQQ